MCSLAGSASAGLILTGNDPAHIALGSQFGAVGWLSSSGGRGSFSVIDDGTWGLTSKHAVLSNQNDPNSFFSNIQVGFGNSVTNQLQVTSAFDIFVHPTRDVALFRFQTTFAGVTPFQRFTGTVGNGTEGFTVGYGQRQYLNDAVTDYTGDKRAGFDVVDGINLFEPENFKTRFEETNRPNYRPLEMGSRPGNSGGGFVLANLGLPTNLLAGIPDSSNLLNGFGTNSFYERIPNEWINSTQMSAVPEPTSIILFSTGIGIVIRRGLRKSKVKC